MRSPASPFSSQQRLPYMPSPGSAEAIEFSQQRQVPEAHCHAPAAQGMPPIYSSPWLVPSQPKGERGTTTYLRVSGNSVHVSRSFGGDSGAAEPAPKERQDSAGAVRPRCARPTSESPNGATVPRTDRRALSPLRGFHHKPLPSGGLRPRLLPDRPSGPVPSSIGGITGHPHVPTRPAERGTCGP